MEPSGSDFSATPPENLPEAQHKEAVTVFYLFIYFCPPCLLRGHHMLILHPLV
jgi:hypothetical protein